MGRLKNLVRRAATRIADRVATNELFEKPGERSPTPPLPGGSSQATGCRAADLSEVRAAVTPSGRPLIVHHWATWCEPCEEELPLIEALRAEVGQDADLVGLCWETFSDGRPLEAVVADVRDYAATAGLGFDNLVVDAAPEAFFSALGLDHQRIPQTLVLAADGRVLLHVKGPVSEATLPSIRQSLRA